MSLKAHSFCDPRFLFDEFSCIDKLDYFIDMTVVYYQHIYAMTTLKQLGNSCENIFRSCYDLNQNSYQGCSR